MGAGNRTGDNGSQPLRVRSPQATIADDHSDSGAAKSNAPAAGVERSFGCVCRLLPFCVVIAAQFRGHLMGEMRMVISIHFDVPLQVVE